MKRNNFRFDSMNRRNSLNGFFPLSSIPLKNHSWGTGMQIKMLSWRWQLQNKSAEIILQVLPWIRAKNPNKKRREFLLVVLLAAASHTIFQSIPECHPTQNIDVGARSTLQRQESEFHFVNSFCSSTPPPHAFSKLLICSLIHWEAADYGTHDLDSLDSQDCYHQITVSAFKTNKLCLIHGDYFAYILVETLRFNGQWSFNTWKKLAWL